MLDINC